MAVNTKSSPFIGWYWMIWATPMSKQRSLQITMDQNCPRMSQARRSRSAPGCPAAVCFIARLAISHHSRSWGATAAGSDGTNGGWMARNVWGFPKIGLPPVIHVSRMFYEPSSYWGSPMETPEWTFGNMWIHGKLYLVELDWGRGGLGSSSKTWWFNRGTDDGSATWA